jgi:signal transduction histidine kinase
MKGGLAAVYALTAWGLFTHKTANPWLGLLGTLAASAAIVLSGRWPVAAVGSALVALMLSPADPSIGFIAVPPMAYAVFRAAAGRRTGVELLGAALAGAVATGLPRFEHAGAMVPFGLIFFCAWIAGYLVEQQALLAATELEQARRGVAEERIRIARELHDIVAHSISVITVQAGFGHLVIDDRPDEAKATLAAIEDTGRQTLTEMRQLLGVLRSGPEERATLAPAPGLGQLDQLIAHTAKAGVRVELKVTGRPDELPAGIDVSAYRIVQEALTNVVRHAGTATADAAIDYRPDELVIEVVDHGIGCPDGLSRIGHGLVGIHERVSLYGGSADTGPLPGRGFRVLARLPIGGRPG